MSSVVGRLRRYFDNSVGANIIYCTEKLRLTSYSCAMCVASDASGRIKGERLFNSDHIYRPYRLAALIVEFVKNVNISSLTVAVRGNAFKADFGSEKVIFNFLILAGILERYSIKLKHIYLIDDETGVTDLLNSRSYV